MYLNRTLESIVLNNYVRYERLQELINFAYAGSSATEINIYIDLYPIIRSIYSDRYRVTYNNIMELVPLLINMCAHYKYFFSRRYNVNATVYLIAGKNIPQALELMVPNYNFIMKARNNGPMHKVMDDMVRINFDIMKILAPYLPDVHFVETEFETSVAIGNIISSHTNPNTPNIIISKDIYGVQLVTNPRFNNTNFIMPIKIQNDNDMKDVSVIIRSTADQSTWEDFWNFITHQRNVKQNSNMFIDPANISPILSLSGLPERSINSLMQFRVVYNMIQQIVGTNRSQCTVETLYSTFDIDGKIPKHITENRFHVIDIIYQLDTLYTSSSEALLLKFENKQDPETVRKICDKYFSNNPINLDKL